MRLNTIPEYSSMETEEEQDGDISISHEYQNLKTKTRDLQELVNKRAAVGIAQVIFPLNLMSTFIEFLSLNLSTV